MYESFYTVGRITLYKQLGPKLTSVHKDIDEKVATEIDSYKSLVYNSSVLCRVEENKFESIWVDIFSPISLKEIIPGFN